MKIATAAWLLTTTLLSTNCLATGAAQAQPRSSLDQAASEGRQAEDQSAAEASEPAASQVPQGVDVSQGGVQDIIVTANRREQQLQDVPISITAITAEAAELQGVTSTVSLQSVTPSLVMTQNANAVNVFLRGVGFYGGSPNDEASAAIYVDGVYHPAPNANAFSLNNIERVEVLKGPQGTLFGRNATAGVVQIVTRNPTFDPTLDLSLGYASYETISGSLYASTGITDTLAIDVALQGSDQNEGWGKNLTTGNGNFIQSNYSARSKVLFKPTDALRFLLAGDFSNLKGPGLLGQPAPGATNLIGQPFPGRYNSYGNIDNLSDVDAYGLSLRADYEAKAFNVASISAYRRSDGSYIFDQDIAPVTAVHAFFTTSNEMFSQEFQISNAAGSAIDWLVGVYYFNFRAGYEPLAIRSSSNPAANFDIRTSQTTKSLAGFGQATIPLGETTNLTLGARYTRDEQSYDGAYTLPGTMTPIIGPRQDEQSFQKFTWRVSLDHEIAPDVLGYVSANRGFKSGGYNIIPPPGAVPPYLPETLDAYEVGLKTTFADRRIRLNGSAFYYSYTDIQYQVTQPGLAFVVNGPKATIWGGEIELQARPTQNLNLSGSVSYLHARYGDFPNAPRFDRTPTGNNVAVPGFNASGNRLAYAPDWTWNVAADYTIPTSVGDFVLAGSVYYNDGTFVSPDNRLRFPSYFLINATIGWNSPDRRYGVQVFARNLANEYYYSAAFEAGGPFGDTVTGAEPRVFGVRLTAKY